MPRRRGSILAAALATIAVIGCTSVGTKFARPEAQEFTLGHTTYAEVVQRLGKPFREEAQISNGKPMKMISYSYATEDQPVIHPGIIGDREQSYAFYNDVMVGESFSSTFREDHTDFDDGKIALIEKGKTTVSEVIALLGRPGGKAVYPLTESDGEVALFYYFAQMRRKTSLFDLETFEKVLLITYDKNDVVTKVDYSQRGTR